MHESDFQSSTQNIINVNTILVGEKAGHLRDMDDMCPDVGFPPMWDSFVDQAMAYYGFTKQDVDYFKLTGRP